MCIVPTGPRGRAARNTLLELSGWICTGLSHERLQHARYDLKQDVLVLQELHGAHRQYEDTITIVCEDPAVNESAAGVMMFLLPRTTDWKLDSGCVGSRIVWVRLQGLFQTLFVVGWYIPHKYRAKPDQMDTFKQIISLIETKVRRGDVIIGIGDVNSRLQSSFKGYMGRYCAYPSAYSGGAMLHELMVDHKLLAASTYFKLPR